MNLRKMDNKRGQMKISFGLIFTIILILFFLTFAFTSIRKNIINQDEILAGKFIHDLQEDIKNVENHEQAKIQVTYNVPEDVEVVYFEEQPDGSDGWNIYFDNDKYSGKILEEVNWLYSNDNVEGEGLDSWQDDKEELNKFQFEVGGGKVSFYLIKEYGIKDVIIDLDGIFELPIREFYSGSPQNHGSYDEIMEKGTSGEYQILFNIDFEERPLGTWDTLSEFRSDWNGASWDNRGEYAEVVKDPTDANNQVMLITFPFWDPSVNETWICWGDGCGDEDSKRIYFNEEPTFTKYRTLLNNVGTASGGMTVGIPLKGSYNEVYLSYNIKHEPDWGAPAGGKLPGMSSNDNCPACGPSDCMDGQGNKYESTWNEELNEFIYETSPDGIADDFTVRHMFHRDEYLAYYYYDYDKINKCGDVSKVPDSMIFDGNWHNIVLRIKLNDPGIPNGITETWIDGENHGAVTNHLFKTHGSTFGITQIRFANFFGGSGMPCSDVADKFEESCINGKWWDPESNWVKSCANDINDPCSGYRKFADGSAQSYWGNRKTEYIHFDDIIAYIPY